jgi:protein-S-isoprenylcysteine O-methyltransferase Ste14
VGFPEIAPDRSPRLLVTEGIYARIRHPRYVQLLIALFGYALIANYGAYLAVASGCRGSTSLRCRRKGMRAHFGAAHGDYCRKVPRFLPSSSGRFETIG